MGLGLWAAVLALGPVLGAAWIQPVFPGIADKAFVRDCVRAHNEYRRRVLPAASNMRHMTWDAALARTARAWANKCLFKHNTYLSKRYQCHPTFASVGENIWVGSYQIFDVQTAIRTWYNENRFYNFSVHTCARSCSHYAQVVWDDSYKLGCAVVFCKEVAGIRNAANFVCNYGPSGNFPRRPYKEGVPCSQCSEGDTCRYKLCKNAERDKIIYYSRWHPPWEFRIICDEACVTLIVSRALLMFLVVLIVYFIKKHFTNMNMST
ncbi:GLIPR1-like protein 1 isoform X1 [Cygnus olor]|uniref:GLIPR1-like protein 1 isoform X1 n=1 Tax=Cygnus olor TaxID=8869 RepID=UPI001ADE9A52|nr:GLIPR1-like protein 1 isoform X1 [Cygnus olor]